MRQIDADYLLDKVLRHYTEQEKKGNFSFVACEIKQSFSDMVNEAPTIEPPRWIPASEPPKVWEDEETKVMIDYLVYSPEYGVFMAHWCAPMERWLIDGESVRVTHWQQLPEGPKEDE